MTNQEQGNAIENSAAAQMLRELFEDYHRKIVSVEAKSPSEAAALVELPEVGTKRVTAEIADGMWVGDAANPDHPYTFGFPEVPVSASRAEALATSYMHVIFSADGRNVCTFLGEDLSKEGKLRGDTVYLPLAHCAIYERPAVRVEIDPETHEILSIEGVGGFRVLPAEQLPNVSHEKEDLKAFLMGQTDLAKKVIEKDGCLRANYYVFGR
jgi:hypothetical protein